MPGALFELVTVPNGARSLRSREHGETFHPGIGPMEEARALHVAQHRLAERVRPGEPFVIWDVGLGAGANALAAIEAMHRAPAPVRLLSFDQTLEPLRFALAHAAELQYPLPWRAEIEALLAAGRVETGSVTWSIVMGDFRERIERAESIGDSSSAPSAVLFDPYSPASNPGMWTREVFQAVRERAATECTLSSYSRSTVTRVNLLRAGWCVGRGSATGEKTETTVAATTLALLREPLGRPWLERVRRSTAPGLRLAGDTAQSIARELESHPQMQ